MRKPTLIAVLAALLATPALAAPRSLQAYMTQIGPEPTARFAYGPAPSQFAELFEPRGAGPFPVVILIHGGCWVQRYGGIVQMRDIAAALAAQGIAVWNVEYRRLDEPGGGYPGTYLDVEAALDKLRETAPAEHLDLSRVVAVGHSAGGHLVQWIAGLDRLPVSSPLHQAHPLRVKQIIGLGSIGDLQARAPICGVDMADLTGRPSPQRPDVFADTSPIALVPNGAHTVLVNGDHDDVSPPATAQAYADKATSKGDRVELLVLPDASHYDEVATASPAWKLILPRIRAALGLALAR